MNDKFYSLPEAKRQAILNAGYRVFSQNSYRKSPMQEIADAAGISKSLLFHYFHNKKELYLFLWESCGHISIDTMTRYGCYEQRGLFEMMEQGLRAKIDIMKKYPCMGAFVIRAFYETDPAVCTDIQKSFQRFKALKSDDALARLDPEQFVEGLDLEKMRREMYLASEGYLWEFQQRNSLLTGADIDSIEKDFRELIEFWKQIYLRKSEEI